MHTMPSLSSTELKTMGTPNCLLIDQGFGGLFSPPFTDRNGEKVNAVTTYDCRTCLCVYVRFESDDVFIAHMCAYTRIEEGRDLKQKQELVRKEGEGQDWNEKRNRDQEMSGSRDEGEDDGIDESEDMCEDEDESESEDENEDEDGNVDSTYDVKWKSDPEKGERLKAAVTSQLHAEMAMHASEPVAEAFAVCPAIFSDGPESNGKYMRDAVSEFFHPIDLVLHDNQHGFVAGPGLATDWLRCVDSRNVEEEVPVDFGWKHVNSYLTEGENVKLRFGPWAFRYIDGRWNVGP